MGSDPASNGNSADVRGTAAQRGRNNAGYGDTLGGSFGDGGGASDRSGGGASDRGGGGEPPGRTAAASRQTTRSFGLRAEAGPKAAAASSSGFFSALGSLFGLLDANITDQVVGINGRRLGPELRDRLATAKDGPFNPEDAVSGTQRPATRPAMSWANPKAPRGKGGRAGTRPSDGQVDAPSMPKTSDTQNLSSVSNKFSGVFGGDSRNIFANRQPTVSFGAAPVKTVAPKKSINSTTSNGSPNDDLFELYRRMLGGFFKGNRV